MKKQRIKLGFSVLVIIILCASLFAACQKIERIEENQVEKIVVWSQYTEEYELSADDSARFMELYNSSKHGGKGTGEGGTPEFGIYVYFQDGAYLCVNDFGCLGKDLEVALYNTDGSPNAWYYINSEELYNFVSELAGKGKESSN